jgi:hypothetical protein
MADIDLEPADVQFLSVLLAQDIRADRARGLTGVVERHMRIWEKLQPACRWDEDDD